MDLGIRGRTAFVLGASSGIGEAVALSLAAEGCRVIVAARRLDRLRDVAARAKAQGAADAIAVPADQSDPESLRAAIAKAGEIDILVINGGGPRAGTFTQISPAEWDAAYAGTMKSALTLTGAVLPGMRARRWGRIVALESMVVKQPFVGMVLSNSFRTAVAAALKSLAGEVAKDGVTVNTIATGFIETARLRSLYDTGEKLVAATRDVPMGRAGSVEEFAPLVTFLCGEGARYVTGQTISIDGGFVSGLFG